MIGGTEGERGGARPLRRALRDFSADRRVLTLAGMAVVTGTAASVTAWILLTLIGLLVGFVLAPTLSALARTKAAHQGAHAHAHDAPSGQSRASPQAASCP